MPEGLPIGYRRFTDEVTRPVYLDQDGRELVIGGDGQCVHGVWLDPRRTRRQEDNPVPIIRGPRPLARESAGRVLFTSPPTCWAGLSFCCCPTRHDCADPFLACTVVKPAADQPADLVNRFGCKAVALDLEALQVLRQPHLEVWDFQHRVRPFQQGHQLASWSDSALSTFAFVSAFCRQSPWASFSRIGLSRLWWSSGERLAALGMGGRL